MSKGKYDDLLEQKSKWEELIRRTDRAQKELLDLMIQLRKELSSLSQLKKNYPDSVQITDRINQCDKLLEQSSETINEFKNQLAGFKKQKDVLDELIRTSVEPKLESTSSPKF